jgi:hypothetical protein
MIINKRSALTILNNRMKRFNLSHKIFRER